MAGSEGTVADMTDRSEKQRDELLCARVMKSTGISERDHVR